MNTTNQTLTAKQFLTSRTERSWAKQFLPSELEKDPEIQSEGLCDPIGDEKAEVLPGLIHRYSSRALLLPTSKCFLQCRFCFRQNRLEKEESFSLGPEYLSYLQTHKEIDEVVLSGGDPLTLENNELDDLLSALSEISHLKFLRFHTRALTIAPQRINADLVDTLKKYQKRFVLNWVAHINHPDELFSESIEAIEMLAVLNIRILTQTVLLKGVNDRTEILASLFKKISTLGISPYYLHHPDPVKGGMHFMLSPSEGLQIYKGLRDQISGWMIPHYIIDSPKGTGKELISHLSS